MLRLTLAQMRRSIGRLTAAGIAILIGTAFVAASLLAGNLISTSAYDAIAAQFAKADLVVAPPGDVMLTAEQVDTIAETDGVASVQGMRVVYQALTAGGRTIYQGVIATSSDPRLMPLELSSGEWPTGHDDIALPADVAKRLKADVGDTIGVETWEGDQPVTDELTVTGLVDDPTRAYTMTGGAGVMAASALTDRYLADGGNDLYDEAMLVLDDGASLDSVRAALLDADLGTATVLTPHERASATAAKLTGGQDVIFLVFVLTFAAIALLVAGLVITNTFQVLVAQRTRTLAMLRAVGASKRQVGAGVLFEAALLGLVASAAGVAVGATLGQIALVVARGTEAEAFLPTSIHLTPAVVLIPLAVGTLVTVVAALVPARIATRVAPLAALRPEIAPSVEKGSAGRVRLVLSTLAVVLGFALLAGGAAVGSALGSAELGLLAGVAGGALSFVGVAVSAVFWIPRVASWAGRLVGLSGPTARLAAANTLRNPRRTAATSTALLIGVTLVAMMSTGAASARTSLTSELDQQFPVDVAVNALNPEEPLSPGFLQALGTIEGVDTVVQVASAQVELGDRHVSENGEVTLGAPAAGAPDEQRASLTAYAVDVAEARDVLNATASVADLAPGTIVVTSSWADTYRVTDGASVEVTGPQGTTTLTAAVVDDLAVDGPLLVPADLARVSDGASSVAWVSLQADSLDAVGEIRDAAADEPTNQLYVAGAAVERESFESVIDTALGIVVGLLAVAVVIALIGVANTLSLSVLERRRESATLRAIGVTRGQLRWMLAVEGMLIAGVGAVLGIALGLVYGWAGALAALGSMGPVSLTMPWRDILLVAAVALVAGLVASVAPGRSAVRPSPVAALATE